MPCPRFPLIPSHDLLDVAIQIVVHAPQRTDDVGSAVKIGQADPGAADDGRLHTPQPGVAFAVLRELDDADSVGFLPFAVEDELGAGLPPCLLL